MSESTALAIAPPQNSGSVSLFDPTRFEHAQRVAKMFSESQLVPTAFQKNLPNCVIAMEIANRMGASHLAVMQSLNIIHGKPSWSSQFIIASINSSQRFTPLRFTYEGTKGTDGWSCFARAKSLQDGEECKGATVSISMAKAEGWYGKSGSKWPAMGELMLMYRAATFFGRMFAPDMLMGMQSEEEVIDVNSMASVNPVLPAELPAETTVRRRTKGVAGMKTVEAETVPVETVRGFATETAAPVQEAPTPGPADVPEAAATETATPAQAEPAAPAPVAEAPAKPVLKTIRAEIVSASEVNASTPTGKAVKIELSGAEFNGVGYFSGPFASVPAATSIVDVTIEKKESPKVAGAFVTMIRSINLVG